MFSEKFFIFSCAFAISVVGFFNLVFSKPPPSPSLCHKMKMAIKCGDENRIMDAISQGVKINDPLDKYDNTAVHVAAQQENVAVLDLLVRKGGSLTKRGRLGYNALDIAVIYNWKSDEMVRHLVLNHKVEISGEVSKIRGTSLHITSITPSIARFLLSNGAEVDALDKYEETPLLMFSRYPNTEVIRVLLEYGADIGKIEPIMGDSALHLSVRHGIKENVNLLLAWGADYKKINKEGKTPLVLAEEKYNIDQDIVDVLEEKENEIESRTSITLHESRHSYLNRRRPFDSGE